MIQGEKLLVRINAIPPDAMRYPSDGDWRQGDAGELYIDVSANMPYREQMLLAIHELVEAFLCGERGVTQEAVDAHDMAFKGDGEPGDGATAPYRREHRFAALVDHLIAHELGMADYGRVDWEPRE